MIKDSGDDVGERRENGIEDEEEVGMEAKVLLKVLIAKNVSVTQCFVHRTRQQCCIYCFGPKVHDTKKI